ncbi:MULTISPECIES: glycosyl hydrolase [unclassified Blastococcus]
MTAPPTGGPGHGPVPGPAGQGRRWLWPGLLVVGLVVALVVTIVVTRSDPDPDRGAAGPGGWLSGASGPGIVTGEFADWRGRDVEIAGTWSDNNEAMVNHWQLQPDAEYGEWDRPMDVAIGAIGEGETWAEAADGAYDDRWRESLTELRDLWADRPGTLYVRFAHESNGNWYPWSVDASEREDFITAWRRFRTLQQEVYPQSQLVFCMNRESVDTGFDWRESFPGAEYVDVYAVDYYNQYPYVATAEDWQAALLQTDQYGAPKGLQAHLDFAREVGLPMAVSEWSGMAENGDSPAFIRGMHAFFAANGGTGAGDLLYEILFDVDIDDNNFVLYGDTRMPDSAEAYRELW